jgi:hypothetical protein
LAALAETAGADAVGSGSDLHAAATKPQTTISQGARHAIVAMAARPVNERRVGDES